MSARTDTATAVLFDAPGPRGRRRIAIISILSVLVILGIVTLAVLQLRSRGQLDVSRWVPFLQGDYIVFLGRGLVGTLTATAVAAVFAFPLALLLALGRLSSVPILSWLVTGWIEFFRAVPLLLVVYFFLLALPGPAIGITLPRFWMLVIPMILVSSATTAEVFRAGIKAVDRGQWEAAEAIGLSRKQILRAVILPQAIRLVLPSLVLALVSLLKDSTLGFVVSYNELQFQGKNLVGFTRLLLQTYVIVSVVYIVLNFLLTRLAIVLEKRMRRRAGAPRARAV
ncbi:ABC transporter permease subunit [Brachybacterium sp. AOP25-B2-12]|uniref:ABC transporter permease subunit n=1 Tax=Brachybacterium sp. AOP25-B2-12 TaxID=3457710 RepID=UPI004033F8F0